MTASSQCVTRASEGDALGDTTAADELSTPGFLEEGLDMGPHP